MIFNAVQFLTYGQMKEIIGHGEILTLPQTFVAGAFTGVAVSFVETPMDLFKSQLQVQIIRAKDNPEYKAEFSTVGGAIKKIIKTNGILGCYQGFVTTLCRDVCAVSLYFGFYEWYRRAMLKEGQVRNDDFDLIDSLLVICNIKVCLLNLWLVVLVVLLIGLVFILLILLR